MESDSNLVSRTWPEESGGVSEVQIDDESGQQAASSLIGKVPWVLVRCSNWKMVPLENLVAESRGTGTRIAVAIEKEIELVGAAFALEAGVDAVLVPSNLVAPAAKISEEKIEIEVSERQSEPLVAEAKVISIDAVGVGERVCVDLTRRLKLGQGMVLGSNSGLLCLVHGETISSEFVPTRPFRVNAGAIHSYALMSDGKTKYLSELNSGDEVAIASEEGTYEKATIGRLKIEHRPLLMIRYSTPDSQGQIVVQQAETVRMVSSEKEVISVTDLEPGDRISVIIDNRARHIGMAVDGGVVEK
tara:strand:- start:5833 stop:6738 length:906 start_codon:yes stop_codon:yes gene_type:complete